MHVIKGAWAQSANHKRHDVTHKYKYYYDHIGYYSIIMDNYILPMLI